MLKINLLPIERQHKERTPLPRFLIILTTVIIVLLILVWDIQMVLKTKSVRVTLKEQQDNLIALKKEVADFGRWKMEEQQLLAWQKTAEIIKSSRPFLWWQQVDVLWDIFGEFPKLWITSFKLSDKLATSGLSKKVEASIGFDCKSFSKGDIEITTGLTNFRRRLKKTSELMNVFNGGVTEPIEFRATPAPDFTPEEPKWILQFKIELTRTKTAKP